MFGSQHGIFESGGPHHHYLEFALRPGADIGALKSVLRDILSQKLTDQQTLVIAFGPALWSKITVSEPPGGLRDFTDITGVDGHTAPATQRDIWVWLQGPRPDVNFDIALLVSNGLNPLARPALEIQGYSYHGNRDLIGFVDGTANPKTSEDQAAAALVPGTNGGSYLLTQKWVHNLSAFNALNVQQQESVVGRTKEDDIELVGAAMPADSHVSRTDASEDGIALKLWRRSSPYGSVSENGLYFVAFACDIHRFDAQLKRMYGVAEDGLHDQLIHYSKATSGAYWYVPGVIELSDVVESGR